MSKLNNYAFIDSQNLNLGVKSQGWILDWRKFRLYLKEKYHITKAFLFIGYKPGNENLYSSLQEKDYIVILKPTLELPSGVIKGNVDAELVLHTMIEFNNYDKAIIVSGDGDFYCLVDYLFKKNKLFRIITSNKHYSKLFKKFSNLIVRIDWLRNSLEYKKKTGISNRSKP
ncbi:MAG: hypothetical protein KatS3mg092_0719 [Patescibacteria group bacterium]|nr:MAG: hypothetical protein KatS3mg092_0719 [Patescibacteria group bacterium]